MKEKKKMKYIYIFKNQIILKKTFYIICIYIYIYL